MNHIAWLIILVISTALGFFVWSTAEGIELPKSYDVVPYTLAEKTFTLDAFLGNNNILDMKVVNTMNEMTDRQKVGQLFMPAVGSNALPFQTVKRYAEEGIISGFMTLGRDITTEQIQTLRNILQEQHGVTALVAIDAEPSLIRSRTGITGYGTTQSYDTEDSSKEVASKISKAISDVGYNINFAPVYDTNANQSVIGSRSYGPTTQITSELGNAFVFGSYTENIATTAKHFPGHGQVIGDSHFMLPTVSKMLPELDAFKSAVDAGVPLVMVGHLALDTNAQTERSGLPATLLDTIMRDLLRNELGFDGVVITDAFNMNALEGFENKEVRSIEAGADIVLMPEGSLRDHVDVIVSKMQQDPKYRTVIEEKVARVIKLRHTLR